MSTNIDNINVLWEDKYGKVGKIGVAFIVFNPAINGILVA